MINWQWITASATSCWMVILSSIVAYLSLLICTRMAGLRSFAKMSSFDFAITIAIGSLLAATVLTKDPPLAQSLVALSTLFLMQYVVSLGRRYYPTFSRVVDNQPVLLMAGSKVLERHLNQVRLSDADLKSKLRQAGIVNVNQVLAVVMETTGDVSVFKKGEYLLDLNLFTDVYGKQHLIDLDCVDQSATISK